MSDYMDFRKKLVNDRDFAAKFKDCHTVEDLVAAAGREGGGQEQHGNIARRAGDRGGRHQKRIFRKPGDCKFHLELSA